MTDLAALFHTHLAERQRAAEEALAAAGFDALVISSGQPHTYFADDQDAPFHSTPHFTHWCPMGGPHHVLLVRPGHRPRLIRYAPEDEALVRSVVGDAVVVRDVASAWRIRRAGNCEQ